MEEEQSREGGCFPARERRFLGSLAVKVAP